MTTATKPLPEHGTYARATGGCGAYPPCRCAACVAAEYAQRKRARINRATGHSFRVDAEPARERLLQLRNDMTWAAIAAATGRENTCLLRIARGDRRWVNRTTHDRIMAVQPTPSPERGRLINATGTMRRLRALKTIGYSYPAISAVTGIESMHLFHIADGRQTTVRQGTAQTIAAAYRRLAMKPAPEGRHNTRARRHAAKQGWHGPLAWDSDTIDDPNAEPDTTGEGADGERKRDNLRPQEIRYLAGFQLSAHTIAKQVGLPVRDVEDRLAKIRSERQPAVAA